MSASQMGWLTNTTLATSARCSVLATPGSSGIRARPAGLGKTEPAGKQGMTVEGLPAGMSRASSGR